MNDCTNRPCCNTCKHSRLQYVSTRLKCVINKSPYANYFGGYDPGDICGKYEAADWFCADGRKDGDGG